jgi:plastocyanin
LSADFRDASLDLMLLAFSSRLSAVAAIGLVLAGCSGQSVVARDVVLVARGMSFTLAADADNPNPVIQLRAGERVRIVLRNEAPGLLHDVVIPEWGVAIEAMRAGEQRDVTFSVPDVTGRFEYRCRPHSEMMKGFVEVTR